MVLSGMVVVAVHEGVCIVNAFTTVTIITASNTLFSQLLGMLFFFQFFCKIKLRRFKCETV